MLRGELAEVSMGKHLGAEEVSVARTTATADEGASRGGSSGESFVELRSVAGAALITSTVFASSVGFLDAYVVNVAVPAIERDLHASVVTTQWALTGYLVTVAAFLLLAGALADRFGRRRVLEIGLLVMLGGGLLCAVSPTIQVLIFARLIQGVGGALVVPSSLALLNGTLPPQTRARGIGIWAGLATLGATLGPYVGGWLVDQGPGAWRWVFVLNVPLILIALATLRHVPEAFKVGRDLSLDVAGASLALLGLGGLIYALTEAPESSWSSPRVIATLLVGILAFVTLVPVEQRRRAPMLRLSLFRSRQFDAINVSTVLLYGALAAAQYLLVLQCELQLGYSAAKAGAVLIPEAVVFLLLSPVSGVLVARLGARWMMVSGMACVATGLVLLSATHAGDAYATAILPGALLWGLGVGTVVTPLTSSVLAAVRDVDLGEAAAVNDAGSRVGGLIVIALVPTLIGATTGHPLARALANGFRPAMISVAALAATAAVVAGVFVRDNRRAAASSVAASPQIHACAAPLAPREVARRQ